jgi:hypothetical protein
MVDRCCGIDVGSRLLHNTGSRGRIPRLATRLPSFDRGNRRSPVTHSHRDCSKVI